MDFTEKYESKAMNCCEMEFLGSNSYYGIQALPKRPVTTMAYVPFQTDTTMYKPEVALMCGTAFPDLNKPFLGGKCI